MQLTEVILDLSVDYNFLGKNIVLYSTSSLTLALLDI